MTVLYVTSGPSLYAQRLVGPIHPDDWALAQDIADRLVDADLADPEMAADGVGASQQVDLFVNWPEGHVFEAGLNNAKYGLPVEGSAVPYRLVGR